MPRAWALTLPTFRAICSTSALVHAFVKFYEASFLVSVVALHRAPAAALELASED